MTATQKKLLAIAVGGGMSSLTVEGFSPQTFSYSKAGLLRLIAVFIVGAVTALIHLYQQPPAPKDETQQADNTRRVGGLALCSLVLMGSMIGCSQQDGTRIAQQIVTWTPALNNAVTTIGSTAALLAPGEGAVFAAATAGFSAASSLVVQYAKAYLANPSATVLTNLQTAVVTLEQETNKALLEVAGIKNAQSQQLALAAVNGVGTIVLTILGLIQSISTKAQLKAMHDNADIKLATVRRLMNQQKLQQAASRYGGGVTVDGFFAYEAAAGF